MDIIEIFELLLNGSEIKTKSQIAELCNVTPQALKCWKRIPAQHCRKLEVASGGRVTRYQMRPDIFGPGLGDDSDLVDDLAGIIAA